MKKTVYIALAAAAVAIGSAGAASAAVPAKASEGLRTAVAPLELVEKAGWRDRRHHRRVCTWRHHRRICWWR